MSTRQKFILTLLAMFAISMASSIMAVFLNHKQEKIITQHNLSEHEQTCNAIIEIKTSRVDEVVYDYTYWDDYVSFIHKPNFEWGQENISSILSSFNVEGVWMINIDHEVVYSDLSDNQSFLRDYLFENLTLIKLHEVRFINYFEYTPIGLIQFHGATIHPTSDPEHKTEPQGYFFIAKMWDDEYIEEMEKLSGSKIEIKTKKDSLFNTSNVEIETTIALYNWQNDEIGAVVFTKKLPFMDLYRITSTQMLVLFFLTALFFILILAFLLSRWVSKPLTTIKEVIISEDLSSLGRLKKSSTDFQRIGELVEQFISQKNELKIAKERAEEADKLKSAFLANMSHEIRTPLFGVLGFTEMLRDKKLDEESRLNYIEIILNSGHHLLSLINDIIDLSKIEAGQLVFHKEEFNLNEFMLELHSFFLNNKFINERKLSLKVSCDLNHDSISIETDRKRLKQIMTNLIGNAIKFTMEGEIEFGYKVTEKNNLLFFVRDTGIGITRELHDKVFERFIQVDNNNSSRQFEGTGLGLSISKALVETIGGKMWLESEVNCGSLFSFSLPVEFTSNTKNKKIIKSHDIVSELELQNNLINKLILIVDDFEHNIYLLKSMFEKAGSFVYEAKSGEQALEMAKHQNFDLILLDIRLKGIDGFETARQMRNTGIESTIIAHTAYLLDSNRDEAFKAGCNEFFTKPIGKKDLVNLVGQVLQYKKG
jgi:signal transduction histidine kinase/ActR/RegA family two-component response regulator